MRWQSPRGTGTFLPIHLPPRTTALPRSLSLGTSWGGWWHRMDPDPFPPSPLLAGPGTRGWQGGSLWALPAGLPLPPATLGCPPGRESPAGAGRGLPTSGATSLRPSRSPGAPARCSRSPCVWQRKTELSKVSHKCQCFETSNNLEILWMRGSYPQRNLFYKKDK